jgi:glycosyltransferase involved in cell wall biosynthesis
MVASGIHLDEFRHISLGTLGMANLFHGTFVKSFPIMHTIETTHDKTDPETPAKRSSTTVVHMTSVHAWNDTRILHKECATLAHAKFNVFLVTTNCPSESYGGVNLVSVPKVGGRFNRMTRVAYNVYRTSKELDGDIYHFHDPEILPWALLLRAKGKKVIYDIHEDYSVSLLHAPYLPVLSRKFISRIYSALEFFTRHFFVTIIAENSYASRFPESYRLLNYPNIRLLHDTSYTDDKMPPPSPRVLYTGTMTESRGALLHAELANAMDDVYVYNVGKCQATLADQMRSIVHDPHKIAFDTNETHVPFERILDAYRQPWTAALALFPERPDYKEKQPTKFFEYMAAGIPVICSDFPAWRELVEENGVGYCVNPHDSDEAAEAIARIHNDPDLFADMTRRARQLVRDRFNWEKKVPEFLDFYDRVAGIR